MSEEEKKLSSSQRQSCCIIIVTSVVSLSKTLHDRRSSHFQINRWHVNWTWGHTSGHSMPDIGQKCRRTSMFDDINIYIEQLWLVTWTSRWCFLFEECVLMSSKSPTDVASHHGVTAERTVKRSHVVCYVHWQRVTFQETTATIDSCDAFEILEKGNDCESVIER